MINMARERSADYFEREDEITRLSKALLKQPGAGRVVLSGPRGAGKTELARAGCHRPEVKSRFADGVLWMDVGEFANAAGLREELAQVHQAVAAWSLPDGRTNGEIAAFLAAQLTANHLMVLDGGWDREVIAPFLGAGCAGAVLVLTREGPSLANHPAELIELHDPNREQRMKMLRGWSGGALADEAVAGEIADAIPPTPRVLQIIGRELRRRAAKPGADVRAAADFILRTFRPDEAAANSPAARVGSPEDRGMLIGKATDFLRGATTDPDTLLKLAKALAKHNEFGLARKLLARARTLPGLHAAKASRGEFVTKHALYTYKDVDQLLAPRLERALEILREGEALEETRDQETLGIAGAIHKRKWEADGQRRHLDRALGYYLRGFAVGLATDYGYTAINAAFILDCLAEQERAGGEPAGATPPAAEMRQRQAGAIREEILRILPGLAETDAWLADTWWYYATLGEAAFGVKDYAEAGFWLEKAKEIGAQPWEYESTARQLAALARLQDGGGKRDSPGWRLITRFTGNEAAAESTFVGKVGVALSGGGFRASLFHIGVLARLAELDLLRSVEVLSCVSGGSIIGTHYYLEVKQLLESKPDGEIERDDYIGIVERVAEQFLAGVQTNIRTRVAAEWWTNVRMTFDADYSRTHRVGELYEKELFSRIGDPQERAARQKTPLRMRDLIIQPKDRPAGFNPRYDNWNRRAKVPMLILNATTLNTGHNWQFTATFMGEPPGAIDTTIDGNDRLRRMYYGDAPLAYQPDGVRLGHAVAASAGVPGLFEPLALAGLFEDMTVRLVDGGVHDNQGVGGLLEQDATFMVVSDASGQMGVQAEPSQGLLGVPLRANDILMARVREAQAQELRVRRRAGLLRGLLFMHMKRDIDVDPRDWKGCPDRYDASDDARPASRRGTLTGYGIRKDMQKRIAALRTDLDAFSDVESFALMVSGYRMTEREAAEQAGDLNRDSAPPLPWTFLTQLESCLNLKSSDTLAAERVLRVLEVGGQLAFKAWRLLLPLQILAVVLGALAVVLLIAGAWCWRGTPLLTVGGVAFTLLGFAASAVLGKLVLRVVNFRAELRRIAVGLAMSLGGFLLARLHLWIFNPLFLRAGSIPRLSRPPSRLDLRRFRSIISCIAGAALLLAWNYWRDPVAGRFGSRTNSNAEPRPDVSPRGSR